MSSKMRFLTDTQAGGRFFPRGAEVQVIQAGSSALIEPDPDAFTTLCAVPLRNLVALRRYRVVLENEEVGLVGEREMFGIDEDDVRACLATQAPQCMILLVEVWGGDGDQ